ncbi:MAG: AsmA family protein [Hyphomicrobiaceae bacterium]
MLRRLARTSEFSQAVRCEACQQLGDAARNCFAALLFTAVCFVSPDVIAGDTVSAQSADGGTADPAPSKPKLDWERASVDFDAESISVNQPRFVIEMPPGAVAADATTDPDVLYAVLRPAFDSLENISVDHVQIIDGTIIVKSAGATIQELTELSARFDVNEGSRSTSGKGSFKLRGEKIIFAASFTRPGNETPRGDIPLKLKFSGAGLAATFDGVMKQDGETRLEGNVDVTVADLKKLVTWSGFNISDGATLNNFKTRGLMAWTSGLVSISDGVFTLDDNEARGILSLDLRGKRTSVEGTLAIKQLNLTNYFPKKKPVETVLLGSLVPELETSTRISAPILRDFDADIRLSVNEVRAHSFRTGEGAMTLTLRSGTLLADVAELRLFDGAAVGQLEFNAKDADVKISARGLLENIAIEKALSWITDVHPLRGQTRLSVNLGGHGETVGGLIQSVKGDARLKMLDGGAFRIDIDGLMQKAEGKTLVGWEAAGDRETEFTTLEARVLLDNGRISTDHLRAKRDDTSVVGVGTINLKAQEVAVRLSVVENPVQGKTAAQTLPSGPTLTLKGPWDEPNISVETQAKITLPNPAGPNSIVLKTLD